MLTIEIVFKLGLGIYRYSIITYKKIWFKLKQLNSKFFHYLKNNKSNIQQQQKQK